MKTIVKNITNFGIYLSVIAIALGIVLMAYPGESLIVLAYIFAAYMIVQGITLIALDIKAWRLYIPFEGMLKGILSVVLGVLLIMYPDTFATYVGIVLGIWIIVSGFSGIKLASALRITNAPWVLMILLNVIDVIIGFFVLCFPDLYAESFTAVIGILMIVYSVITVVYMIAIKKNAEEVEKIISEKAKAFENNAENNNDIDIEAED